MVLWLLNNRINFEKKIKDKIVKKNYFKNYLLR